MNRFTLFVLLLLAAWSGALTVHAQTGAAIPIFSFDASGTNGAYPEASLTLGPGGIFYGTTEGDGAYSDGTIFTVTTNGTVTTLITFNGANGANPLDALTPGPNGSFYGTTEYGGNTNLGAGLGAGTVFLITNGTLTTLAVFGSTNGSNPHAGLTWGPDGNLYGTASGGGPNGLSYGTVFQVTPGGTLTMLTNFNSSDGGDPAGGLTLGLDGNFYGTTESGGSAGGGTVFQVTTNGTLTTLVNFGTNNLGVSPAAGLTLGPDGNFYGVTSDSYLETFQIFPGFSITVPGGNGTFFRVTTNGTLTTLVDFDNYSAGINPNARLTLGPDGNFYGTTYLGGSLSAGTIYEVTTNNTLTTVANFNNTNGAYPVAGLTLGPDGNFYGATSGGGSGTNGTIYRVGLPPDFISSPVSRSVIIGNSATFASQPFGTAPFAFQWLSNNIPVTGATGSALSVPHVSLQANNAEFQILVTNSYGSITSQLASLTVVQQPNSYAVASDGGGSYTVFVASYPSTMNRLWATTNLASPSSWQVIDTITTDANGMGQFLDMNPAGSPMKYYRLSYP